MIGRRLLTGAACVAGLTLIAPHAVAGTIWQTGKKVAESTVTFDFFTYSWPDTKPCDPNGMEAVVAVKLAGDYVYVLDDCKDGRSAMAMVTGYDNGEWVKRKCRNPHGVDTWARCNFDWPEGAEKNLIGGSYDGDTGDEHWSYGNAKTWTSG